MHSPGSAPARQHDSANRPASRLSSPALEYRTRLKMIFRWRGPIGRFRHEPTLPGASPTPLGLLRPDGILYMMTPTLTLTPKR
jgi:hypothetical protein